MIYCSYLKLFFYEFVIFLLLLPFSLIAQHNKESNSIVAKAAAFINSLNEQQKKKVLFSFNELNRYEWHYVPPTQIPRRGIASKDLASDQRESVYLLLQAVLSKEGYDKTKNIMAL